MGAYRTSSADGTDGARSGTTIGASSAASFTCCNRVRVGAIVRVNTALTRPSTIASIVGPSADDGAQSLKRWPTLAKIPSRCRSTRPRSKLIVVPPAEKGEHNQAIGRSRGGRTTKIHALSDPLCRPVVLHLTPGQDADIAAAPDVLALAPPMRALLADKGYDGDSLRAEIVSRGAKPVIPNKSNRIVIHRSNKRAYKGRNVIERCFCRLKDFR